jgi:hypothetical protein
VSVYPVKLAQDWIPETSQHIQEVSLRTNGVLRISSLGGPRREPSHEEGKSFTSARVLNRGPSKS